MRPRLPLPPQTIVYPPMIPYWFTYLVHVCSRRRCRRIGHEVTVWRSCSHCGLKL